MMLRCVSSKRFSLWQPSTTLNLQNLDYFVSVGLYIYTKYEVHGFLRSRDLRDTKGAINSKVITVLGHAYLGGKFFT